MFYDIFYNLCNKRGTSPDKVIERIGLNPAICATWSNGLIPDIEVLIKIADYLEVSIDYLVGRTDVQQINSRAKINSNQNSNYNKHTDKSSNCKEDYTSILYNDIIKHLNNLPAAERHRAIADILDLLNKKYPLDK